MPWPFYSFEIASQLEFLQNKKNQNFRPGFLLDVEHIGVVVTRPHSTTTANRKPVIVPMPCPFYSFEIASQLEFLQNKKNQNFRPGFLLDVEHIGVEPMTFWLPAKRSSQLS